jgi:serine/threonine protein kinase
MTLVSITALDGSPVEFIKKDPKQGGVKDVYFSPKRDYVVAFYREKLDSPSKERLERLVGKYRTGIFGQLGSEFWKDCYRWPEKIVEYNGLTGIVVPIYQPNFFFGEQTTLGGGEKEGKWFASAKNFNRFVPHEEKGDLMGYLKVCLNLSRGVRRLHAAGLAHSDLSYKNCLVDPKNGKACIIDIDGLVVPGLFPPDVVGTPDFIAPEVVTTLNLRREDPNKFLPTQSTDRHALAVLIYLYLFHRHPLRGQKVHDKDDTQIQESLEMGERALFVEHPSDSSNRIKIDKNDKDFLPWIDTKKLPYTIMGPYLKEMFDQAFVEGLHQPDRRPSANDWEDALVKTSDLLQPCSNPSCLKKWYVFDNSSKPVCPYCKTPFQGLLPVLDFYSSRDGLTYRSDNYRLMIFSNQHLYRWHAFKNVFPNEKLTEEDRKSLGYFSFFNNDWVFVNTGLDDMRDISNDKPVRRGEGVKLTEGAQWQFSSAKEGRLCRITLVKS